MNERCPSEVDATEYFQLDGYEVITCEDEHECYESRQIRELESHVSSLFEKREAAHSQTIDPTMSSIPYLMISEREETTMITPRMV